VVQITVPPGEVDANVHPTKREVRLLRERIVFGIIQQAIRATLVQTIGIPRIGERPWDRGADERTEGLGLRTETWGVPQSSALSPQSSERPRLGSLRILGQVGLTYIICEGQAGLYLVDQHAAHERVTLERLERDLQRRERSQLLLEPTAVELPHILRAAAEEYVEALVALGFAAELLGQHAVVVRAVPTALRARDIDRVLHETHEALDAEGAGPDWRERLAVLLSCKTAIKAGQRLEVMEMQSLLAQLDEATLCATCSHGRPTAILLSHSQLEREFGRR
jgi:DNA mismatch repair protein MutL